MKQYVIDELRTEDYEKIKRYFNDNLGAGGIDGIYWIPIEPDLLTQKQAVHTQCQPLYFMVDLKPDRLCCELLVRTQYRVRCSCIDYATDSQRNWLIRYIDCILNKLNITA
ncbi:MAG: hypothetical protein JRH18_05240 [Deltaproteobacteria bacterium]|nr:hypothetical protein [Deltaproteobacteria bacterium]MBW1962475.1 hypothetical protein [Deltaproteobacteria bacterium]MBW2151051.1 hypothetical protein [Deltaproteobacteria bacterium]